MTVGSRRATSAGHATAMGFGFAALCIFAGCSTATRRGADPGSGKSCPTAEQLWPYQPWTETIAKQAAEKVVALVRSRWLSKRSGADKLRIAGVRMHNRTDQHVRDTVGPLVERDLLAGGRVVLVADQPDEAKPKPDDDSDLRRLSILVREENRRQGQKQVSSFVFLVELVGPQGTTARFKPGDPESFRITRSYDVPALPAGCPEPTWICPETGSSHAPASGCGTSWHCRNGTFRVTCGAKRSSGGSAEASGRDGRACFCEAKGKKQAIELDGSTDLCEETFSARASARAANRSCGWHLPD